MNASLSRKVLILAIALPLVALLVVGGPVSIGQDGVAKKTEAKVKGRLPAYYADVVTDEQREKIYVIQAKYAEELKSLDEQILAITKKQNDEIESLLSAEQKQKIDKATSDGAAKKKKKAADKAKSSAEKKPTESKTK